VRFAERSLKARIRRVVGLLRGEHQFSATARRIGFVLGGLTLALGLYVTSSLLPEEWNFALPLLPRDTTASDARSVECLHLQTF
jgi:hypothetical protein